MTWQYVAESGPQPTSGDTLAGIADIVDGVDTDDPTQRPRHRDVTFTVTTRNEGGEESSR